MSVFSKNAKKLGIFFDLHCYMRIIKFVQAMRSSNIIKKIEEIN